MTPKLQVDLEIENGCLSEPQEIIVEDGTRRPRKIRFLRVGVSNDGRTTARDCAVSLKVVKRRSEGVASLLWTLRWQAELTETSFKASDLQRSIVKLLPEERNIERGPGRLVCLLFTLEDDTNAYLTSTRPDVKPAVFDFKNKEIEIDIELEAVGSDFASQSLGRFHISIHSWDDIDISEVTFTTRLHDFVKKALIRK